LIAGDLWRNGSVRNVIARDANKRDANARQADALQAKARNGNAMGREVESMARNRGTAYQTLASDLRTSILQG
jgi:hypothetical protein